MSRKINPIKIFTIINNNDMIQIINVIIFANAVIIGKITIGDNAIIGAGSVVLNNVEANTVVAGNPAKLIK